MMRAGIRFEIVLCALAGAGLGCTGRIRPAKNLPQNCQVGNVTLHRLNRAEYNNTVRDLLQDTTQPANGFPTDEVSNGGFDNNADVLALSDLLYEKYEAAAQKLVATALWVPHPVSLQFQALNLMSTCSQYGCSQLNNTAYVSMWAAGNGSTPNEMSTLFNVQDTGTYTVSVHAFASASTSPILTVLVDGIQVGSWTVTAPQTNPQTYQGTTLLNAGNHKLEVQNASTTNTYAQDLDIDVFTVAGPTTNGPPPNAAIYAQIMSCGSAPAGTDGCARIILSNFVGRAWRRPATSDEVDRLDGLVQLALQQGDDFNTGIELALKAVLLAPEFLYRVELDPDPTSKQPHPLTDYELASRLSYFLWSSMPDDALLQAAAAGTLHQAGTLPTQVDRMLADPKAAAFTQNFAGQWLNQRVLAQATPNTAVFPEFNEGLRQAMASETQAFFQDFLSNNRNALDMLDAPFTYVNAPLAQLYGLSGVTGTQMQKVSTDPGSMNRGGLLTQAGILTSTALPNRTSIPKRGKWVMTALLCSPPPPPPPGVPQLSQENTTGLSLRQQMEQHDTNPACSGCHKILDPIGFGLENYDGVGAWRTMDGTFPIDASGALSGGGSFNGPQQLSALIKQDSRLPSCIVHNVTSYGLGRDVASGDSCTVQAIQNDFSERGYTLSEAIHALVQSPAFTQRQGSLQ